MEQKVGRNDLCPCGSGKKYKQCCLKYPTGRKKIKATLISGGSSSLGLQRQHAPDLLERTFGEAIAATRHETKIPAVEEKAETNQELKSDHHDE